MPRKNYISSAVIHRLPRYYRYLKLLINEGKSKISSGELANRLDLTSSQIRQDLGNFGGFGQQGYGYEVEELMNNLAEIIGLNKGYKMVILGAGNFSIALAKYLMSHQTGFELIGIFDETDSFVGKEVDNITILPTKYLEKFCKENEVKVAALCVTNTIAKDISDYAISCGIKNFWNFTSYDIGRFKPEVIAEHVHLNDSLMSLCYKINDSEI